MLKRLYLSNVILSGAYALTAYISSLFLTQFITEKTVGILFAASSLLALIGFKYLPAIICRIGNKHTLLTTLAICALALGVLSLSTSPLLIAVAFVCFQTTNTLSFYLFDLIIEHFSEHEAVGKVRGAYLALSSVGWVIAQVATGPLLKIGGYVQLYGITGMLIIVVILLLAIFLREYHDTVCRPMPSFEAFSYIEKHPNLALIMCINAILQFFYAWMVIYASIHLINNHGFTAETLGPIFAIMLLAFVFFEYPFGRLADRIGEKKVLIGGLFVMGLSTLAFAQSQSTIPFIFALILFMTRTGAAAVEVASEAYFFKHVSAADTRLISLFRAMRPLTLLIAPLLASLLLTNKESYSLLFTVLAIIILLVSILPFKLNETKTI